MDGSTILQKSHHSSLVNSPQILSERKKRIAIFRGRAVVIVRNPYKAFISYWNLRKSGSHTGKATRKSFVGEEFR